MTNISVLLLSYLVISPVNVFYYYYYSLQIVLNKRTSLEMTSNYGHDWVLLNDFESNDNLDENVRRALEADLKVSF